MMRRLIWFIAGAITLALFSGAGVILFLKTQTIGFSARSAPNGIEPWVARQLRALTMPASAKERRNPEPDSMEVLAEGRAHWADHCAVCHANNGSGDIAMGKHLYPSAPDMRQAETQNLTDGELLFIIQNGVRYTGMPGWGSGTGQDEQDSWKLVRFIRHLPKLSASEELEMQALNPKSAGELEEEKEETDFLNGGETHEEMQHQHH